MFSARRERARQILHRGYTKRLKPDVGAPTRGVSERATARGLCMSGRRMEA